MNETQTPAPAVDLSDIHIDKLVRKFVRFRDEISAITRELDARTELLKGGQDAIENELLRRAHEQGVTGFNTEFGTTYLAVDTNVSIADDKAFYAFPQAIEMLQRRVSSTAVKEYMSKNGGHLPPGLNIFNEQRMKIRRSQNGGKP